MRRVAPSGTARQRHIVCSFHVVRSDKRAKARLYFLRISILGQKIISSVLLDHRTNPFMVADHHIATLRLPPTILSHLSQDQDYEDYRSGKLYDAAARGELRHVHELLEEGVDPDWCCPEDGLTPLHIAAMKGRAECLLRLLRAGADIYATGAHGCTALDLFKLQKIPFWICDTLFQGRSYRDCRTYLRQAHADCQRRAKEAAEYKGIVVIHPGEELGILREVCEVSEEVREEVRRFRLRKETDILARRCSRPAELGAEFDLEPLPYIPAAFNLRTTVPAAEADGGTGDPTRRRRSSDVAQALAAAAEAAAAAAEAAAAAGDAAAVEAAAEVEELLLGCI